MELYLQSATGVHGTIGKGALVLLCDQDSYRK